MEADEFHLVDDYAAGALPSTERKQLATWIESSPELRARVLIAQHLHRSSRRQLKARPRWSWWIAGVAATCLLLLTISILPRHRTTLSQTASNANPSPAPTPLRQDTVLLIAERQRDNTEPKRSDVYIVHNASTVRLQILMPSSASKVEYRGWLRSETSDKGLSLHFPAVSPTDAEGAHFVELLVPPGVLHSDQYALQLSSRTGSYDLSFRVEVK